MSDIVDVTAIRQLNDQSAPITSRRGRGVTAGVRALGEARLAKFDSFDADNDSFGEQNFGAVEPSDPDSLLQKPGC